jgi:hypothetical protein
MDWRPGPIKRMDLKKKCLDLVTDDRITFWLFTLRRLELKKISLSGLLRLCLRRSKD